MITIKQEFKENLQITYPFENIEIIEYSEYKKPTILKCLNCQKQYSFSNCQAALQKVNLCSCNKKFKGTKEKVYYLCEQYDKQILNWTNSREPVEIKCNKCGAVFSRYPTSIFRNPLYCENCNNYAQKVTLSITEVQDKINNYFQSNDYILIDYKGYNEKAHIRHCCGFIITCTPGHLLDSKGCPKCNKLNSKGENAICLWLKANNINFIQHKGFINLNNRRGYFDFYLPEYNIAIEYNGEQHYNANNYFNIKNGFEYQKNRDKEKREYCLNKGIELIEIPYWELKNIDIILSSKFNDHP